MKTTNTKHRTNRIHHVITVVMFIGIFMYQGGTGNAFAQAGSLDPSFDNDGIVTTDIGSSNNDRAYSVAIQSDGKIVVAGFSNTGFRNDFTVVRYNSDGSLDTSFDNDGKVTTDIGSSSDDQAYSVAIQSDGKIVVAGYRFNGSDTVFALVRYNSDGSLDTSFDNDGKVTTTIGSGGDFASSVAVQSDGKIVAVGHCNYGFNNEAFAVARYNSDGSLDTSFDNDGIIITPIGGHASSVAIQHDGKIVVAGHGHSSFYKAFAVVRYNSDGSLDTTFDNDGIVTTTIGSNGDFAYSVAIQSDGKIVLAGHSHYGSNTVFAVVRYNSDGSLDTSFNNDGKVNTVIGSSSDYATSVAIQSDSKIVVAGFSYNDTHYHFAVVRYNSDGSLDPSFDNDGKVTTAIGSRGDLAYSVAIQSDGKIVVAGFRYNGSDDDFTVVRYSNTPLSVTASAALPDLKMYPNPTSGLLTVELGQVMDEVIVSVKNTLGQEVYYKRFNSANLLEINLDAPDGVYFVTLSSQNRPMALLKVIKQ